MTSLNDINPDYRGAGDKYGTEFDVTQLRQSGHGKVVHRDYLAHCLRWGWVARNVRFGAKILDAGCGQDVSMYDVLAGTKTFAPNESNRESRERPIYVGVDLNSIKKKCGAKWAHVQGETNIIVDHDLPHWGEFDMVVSLEVIEHMSVDNGRQYLDALRDAMSNDGRLVLSTPVFNGRAAKNHIHEYTIDELNNMLYTAGFEVVERWGTFMSWNDMVKVVDDGTLKMMETLREYLGPETVACFLAPLYPDSARNNMWLCRKRPG